jgi:hypothetical protein
MIVGSLMRLVVTCAILAAAYFLILKPVLDTTDSITHDVSHAVNHGLHSAQHEFNTVTGQSGSGRKHHRHK